MQLAEFAAHMLPILLHASGCSIHTPYPILVWHCPEPITECAARTPRGCKPRSKRHTLLEGAGHRHSHLPAARGDQTQHGRHRVVPPIRNRPVLRTVTLAADTWMHGPLPTRLPV